jgi:hypothetical protein
MQAKISKKSKKSATTINKNFPLKDLTKFGAPYPQAFSLRRSRHTRLSDMRRRSEFLGGIKLGESFKMLGDLKVREE